MESNSNDNMLSNKIVSALSNIKLSNKPTMFNISKYIKNIFSNACKKAFPVGNDFDAQITWNYTGSSDLTCPSAMKIFNMNCKKEGWTLPSSKEVAEEIITNVEENSEFKIIGDIKISQQIMPPKKEHKEAVVDEKKMRRMKRAENKKKEEIKRKKKSNLQQIIL